MGGVDARRYAKVVAANSDFRKFDDGLKMTLDCDPATRAEIEKILEDGKSAGPIRYRLRSQSEAMMTCILPSFMRDDHVHFIDGAAGGYMWAAKALKTY